MPAHFPVQIHGNGQAQFKHDRLKFRSDTKYGDGTMENMMRRH